MLRTSHALGYKASQTLYYAMHEHAARIGCPLTHWVTINFALTTVDPWEAVPVFQKIRKNHFNKWARRPGKNGGAAFQPTYAYVFENARDDEVFDEIGPGLPHNVHVHFAVHLPPSRVFEFETRRILEWVDRHCDGTSAANAVQVKPIDDERGGTMGLRQYVLKGSAEKVAPGFGVDAKPQGAIIGKRSGVSVNLGPSARVELDRRLGIRRRWAA